MGVVNVEGEDDDADEEANKKRHWLAWKRHKNRVQVLPFIQCLSTAEMNVSV